MSMNNNDDERDGLAKAMCAIEARSKAATLEEVQAGIQRWTRHRYEADRLIEELADYGLSVRRSEVPEPSAEDLDYYDPARQDLISEHDCVFEDGEWWFGHGMPCKHPKLHEEPQGEPSDAQTLADEIEDRMRRQEWLPADLAIRAVTALRAASAVTSHEVKNR